ncbi:hypothetical protein D9M69_474440 [compost metagenome]
MSVSWSHQRCSGPTICRSKNPCLLKSPARMARSMLLRLSSSPLATMALLGSLKASAVRGANWNRPLSFSACLTCWICSALS